ncbi:nicotinamide riboside transporter PnuC [Pannus brasiliensis CCIBt3594]|uniref:Nicotinamide riboside transporter PnuC n=1 Tax=Pannus brasiliensis CCIBt3594 TaxID=1427578 RepID=A0AAW9QTD1_9CHRO
MLEFWSVNSIAFTVLGYSVSYLELAGTILYLGSVWLIARGNILTWPVGIASVLLYMVLFYQIRLYSDFLEQIYYLIVSIYGWWRWRDRESDRTLKTRYGSPVRILAIATGTIAVSMVWGAIMSRIHLFLPVIFPEPADFPYLDALTTGMSFTAMALMPGKYVESWYYWIVVDSIAIGLYRAKGVIFLSLLYAILLVMAIGGLRTWKKATRATER